MRFLHALPCFLFLLAAAGTASAQSDPGRGRWSGRVSLTAGGGYQLPQGEENDFPDTIARVRESAEALIRYDRRKFGASLQLRQSLDRKGTDANKQTYTLQDPDTFSRLDLIARKGRTGQALYEARTDLRWTPSDRTRLTGFVRGSFQRDTALNDLLEMELVEGRIAVTTEAVDNSRKTFGTGFRGEQRFAKRRSLSVNAEWSRDWNGKCSHWYGEDTGREIRYRSYRLTPDAVKDRVNAAFFYRDSTFAGVDGLLFEPGIRMTLTRDDDRYSGATQREDGTWQDSLGLREHFDFLTFTLEPYARADYRREKLTAYLEAGLQFYGTRLNNETHHQAPAMNPVKPVCRLGARWQVKPAHALFGSASLGIQRPVYEQICWYPRQGSYTKQLFIGNPDLLATQLLGTQLGYRFQISRFSAEYTSSYSRRNNEVVRTFTDVELDGRKYKRFTWVNAARTRTWIEKVTLGWNGTVVKANASCLYHDLRQKQDPTDKVEENRYWELDGNLQVLLPAQWTLSADVNYHGRIKTLYQLIDPYVRLNARVQKRFGSAWTLFLEGRDLLERPLTNGIISGFTKETWLEETRQNRRLIQLGAVWQF